MAYNRGNVQKRIENVRRIVEENYEPGNQNRCKLQVYRSIIMKIYPMSERTFWRYVKYDLKEEKQEDKRQMSLF